MTLKQIRTQSRPKVVDLFTGVGGLSLGFEQAGFDVIVGVEIDETAGKYSQYNFPSTKVLFGAEKGDVRKFGAATIQSLGMSPDDIFMVVGGPPCQGFSVAGKKRADDPLNSLVLEFARVVAEIDPPAFLMENVPGLKTSDSPMLGKALEKLAKRYCFVGPETLRAWDYGVPQMRQRVFILGIRRDLGIRPTLPPPSHQIPKDPPSLFLKSCPTCWEAISDIPPVDEYPELISGDRVPYVLPPQNDFQREMRREGTPSVDDYSPSVMWDSSVCTNLRRTQHGRDILGRFHALAFGMADKQCGIRRLDPDDISTTIRAGTTKERGSWSAPRPLHPFQYRFLTTRECARIKTFPDWFSFHPVKWHGNRQVGNAVPPRLAKAIALHVRRLFGLPPPTVPDNVIVRDFSLIKQDIEDAKNSGYEFRKVSQKVTPWGRKARKGNVV